MFEQQIKAGAKLLDEKIPEWESRQDLEKLDLGDTCNCVIGQAYPDKAYLWALMELFQAYMGNVIDASIDYGFSIGEFGSYTDLTEEWKQFIQERRHDRS